MINRKPFTYLVLFVITVFAVYSLVSSGANIISLTREVAEVEAVNNTNQTTPIPTPTTAAEPTLKLESVTVVNEDGNVFLPESEGIIPDKLTVPSLDLILPVRYVPLVDGTWEVNPAAANYAEGTNLINSESGNVGLFGHDRDNAFRSIKDLKVGDSVILTANQYTVYYEVTDSFDTIPEDLNVFAPTDKPTVTLLTCSGTLSERRYVVVAELTKIELTK
ncbi:sortase [candidate division WWE3 bacterium]|uniref:Sortase n=1 Tax=candidate division WWE3 bacterium TaxID=2053526 RepID=A0A955RQL3_UNCKA|nr:sortase [candidate division WWE3 bacterium]